MKKLLIALLFLSFNAHANIIINGTRVVYPESSKSVSVQLVNNGDAPSLVQAWIDDGDIDSTPETANVPFLLSPPVVKVNADSGQQLRIEAAGANLAADRETVFYLNVLDIPPTPEHLKGQNILQLAIKSRIKMFYRPTKLMAGIEKSVDQITLSVVGQVFHIKNNSPYFVSVANISLTNSKESLVESFMIDPLSEQQVASNKKINKGAQYQITYIDDFGAYKVKSILAE